jgi:hypothetical protein
MTRTTRTTRTRLIVEQWPNSNSRKRLALKPKSGSRKKSSAFLFEEIHALKKQLKSEKTASSKRNTKKG